MKIALLALFAAACGSETASVLPDTPDVFDAPASSCGPEALRMSGAYTFETRSVATVEVQQRVIGVGGFGSPTTSYAFTVVDVLTAEVATIGVHDVGATHLKFVLANANANCQNAGECAGFMARSGTYDVVGTAPYRATFDLGDIVAYDGSSSSPMPPIAGRITGCLEAAP